MHWWWLHTHEHIHRDRHTHIQTTDSLPTLSIIIQYIKPHPQARKVKNPDSNWTLEKCNFPFLWPWKFTLWHTLIQEMRYFQSWTAFIFSGTSMKHALEEKCCSTSCAVITGRRGQGWGRVTDQLQLEDHGRLVTVWKALCAGHSCHKFITGHSVNGYTHRSRRLEFYDRQVTVWMAIRMGQGG